jgi:hypothetical protein
MAFWYLASPYSKYRWGAEAAYEDVCRLAARLIKSGISVYSPIAHTHGIAVFGGLPGGYEHWASFDEDMIGAASGIIVAMMDGWKQSEGIAAEIAICERMSKSVRYVDADLTFYAADVIMGNKD